MRSAQYHVMLALTGSYRSQGCQMRAVKTNSLRYERLLTGQVEPMDPAIYPIHISDRRRVPCSGDTHILHLSRLDFRVKVEPVQDLVARHACHRVQVSSTHLCA